MDFPIRFTLSLTICFISVLCNGQNKFLSQFKSHHLQFSMGYGMDTKTHPNPHIQPGLVFGSFTFDLAKPDHPHYFGIELIVTGRMLDIKAIENVYEEGQAKHEDLRYLTEGENTLTGIAPRYSYVLENDDLIWSNGLSIGLGMTSKQGYRLKTDMNGDYEPNEVIEISVGHGPDFIGALSFYSSLHSNLVFRMKQKVSLLVGTRYFFTEVTLKNQYVESIFEANGSMISDITYYTERDQMSRLNFYLGLHFNY